MMNTLKPCNSYNYCCHSPFYSNRSKLLLSNSISFVSNHTPNSHSSMNVARPKKLALRASIINEQADKEEGEEGGMTSERQGFLSLEEAGLVEISGLNTHERFLCRLTISSLNLLRVIAKQEDCSIEELNAGRICDWFLKDKLKREQNIGSAVLQWDDDDPFEDFV